MHTVKGKLESTGGPGAWTILPLPENVSKALGSRSTVRVRGTIDGRPFRSTAMPKGDGTFYLVVNKQMRAAAGVEPGDTVSVELERDDSPRELELPDALADALARSSKAAERWEELPPSAKKQYIDGIASAKTDATRERRVSQAIDRIKAGKRLRG
jgi:hypothetical protein